MADSPTNEIALALNANTKLLMQSEGSFSINLNQDHIINTAVHEEIQKLRAIEDVIQKNTEAIQAQVAETQEEIKRINSEISQTLSSNSKLDEVLTAYRQLVDTVSELQGRSSETYGTSLNINNISVVRLSDSGQRTFTEIASANSAEFISDEFAMSVDLSIENHSNIAGFELNNIIVSSETARKLLEERVARYSDLADFMEKQSELLTQRRDVTNAIAREDTLRRTISAAFTKAILSNKINSVDDFFNSVNVGSIVPDSVREIYDTIEVND